MGMQIRYYPKNTEVLKRIDPRDEHAVIEASAGTGKTYTIERLFVDILLGSEATVENILVVTFTEKAGGELRKRIREIIQDILDSAMDAEPAAGDVWRIGDRERNKLERALFSFDKAPIHTIHGFFHRVLMETAFAGGRLFDQALTDSRGLFAEEFRRLLRARFAREEDTRLLLADWLTVQEKSIEDLEEFLFKCHQKRCRILPVYDPVTYPAQVRALAAVLRRDLEPAGLRQICKSEKVHGNTINAIVRKVEKLLEALEPAREGAGMQPPLRGITNENIDYLCQKLPARLNGAIGALGQLQDLLITEKAQIVHTMLPRVRASLQRRKLAEGLYDFDDMIGFLLDALEGPQGGALIEGLRKRYRYALVDESQDTDALQWKVFRKVFFESGTGNPLYLIGDPKQAIYAFRGADVYTYLSAKRAILARTNRPAVPLQENFRSTDPLIRGYNLLFDQQAARPFFTNGEINYDHPVVCGDKDLRALGPDGRPIVPITVWQVPPRKKTVDSQWYRRCHGSAIAAEIASLLGAGAITIERRKNGAVERTPVRAGDIFILTRSEREGREVAKHLRRLRIPFAFYKQDGLFQTREAEEIRDLLAAIAEPDRHSRRMKAWMTAFFGLSIDQLGGCRDLPENEPFLRKLREWHELAKERDYRTLFTRLVDESGLVPRALFYDDSERELTNYQHIFEILLEETANASHDITSVVHRLGAFIAETEAPARDNGNIQRLDTEKDAVQIMTLHKSKGLEAAVVFLYGGYTTVRDRDLFTLHVEDAATKEYDRMLFVGNDPPRRIIAQAGTETDEEHQRLLYVGITRAKARLYLPLIRPVGPDERGSKMDEGPYNQVNQRLWDLLEDERGTGPSGLFRLGTLAEPTDNGEDEPCHPSEADALAEALELEALDPRVLAEEETRQAGELARVRSEHAGFNVTSYTWIKNRLAAAGEGDAGEEERERSDRIAVARAGEGLIGGPEFGSAVHRIMERLPFGAALPAFAEWSERPEVRELFESAFRERNLDPAHLPYARELVYRTLTTPVDLGAGGTIPGLGCVTELVREMEFTYPYPEAFHPRLDQEPDDLAIDRGFVKGVVDLIFRAGGRAYLLDWKTDILADYSRERMEAHFQEHYELQAKLYLLALVKLMRCRSAAAYDAEFGGILYCFLRGVGAEETPGNGVLLLRPDWNTVLAWEQELVTSRQYI